MKFGANVSLNAFEHVETAKKLGFDFLEANFQHLARGDNAQYESFKKAVLDYQIPCEASNCLMPGDLPVVGENVDYGAIEAYLEKGLYNGAMVGLERIAFGSGAARNCPEGFPYDEAIRQLKYFLCEKASPLCEKYGVTITIEPLNPGECNMINTLKEGSILASLTEKSNIKVLADNYHMKLSGESYDNIKALKGQIAHAHISYPFPCGELKRTFPKDINEYDYKSFVDALREAQCDSLAIEAATLDFAKDAPFTMEVFKKL